jgi:hypothetical protein
LANITVSGLLKLRLYVLAFWEVLFRTASGAVGGALTYFGLASCNLVPLRRRPYRKSNPDVLMVQSSQGRLDDDATNCLNRPRNRCILAQRQVAASLIVLSPIRFEQMAKMPLAKYNDPIQAIPPDRADQPFRVSVWPWRSRRGRPVTNAGF